MNTKKPKKKILYIITKSNFGGAQRYVYDLSTSLPKEQFDVAVVLGGDGLLKEKLELQGIRTISLPNFGRDVHIWNDIKIFFTLIHLFRKEQPDVIHLNSSKAGILGAVAGRVARVPRIIFTAHGWAFNERRPFWQKIFFLIFHWKTILFSHMTIAVSQKTKEQITWMPFTKNKIFVIHNGIRKTTLKTREEARTFFTENNNALQAKKESFWIGTVAELHKIKGIACAIEAMRDIVTSIPNIIYIIIGIGEEQKKLEEIIEKHNLQKNVFLLGFIPNAARYLAAFDIILISSISEALPYTPLEAGLAKLPVIASAVGGISEIIKHGENGMLIVPKNKDDIVQAISKLAKNREMRFKFGENLFQTITNKFSFEEMIKKTTELYR